MTQAIDWKVLLKRLLLFENIRVSAEIARWIISFFHLFKHIETEISRLPCLRNYYLALERKNYKNEPRGNYKKERAIESFVYEDRLITTLTSIETPKRTHRENLGQTST